MQYPTKKKVNSFTHHPNDRHYTSYRGMNLEEDISNSNQYYLETDRAVIYKKPTPVQIVKVDYPARNSAKIVEAYYQRPSTTDYNGLYRGKYIDFEAKECKKDKFPFVNIHAHQIDHLERVLHHGGIGFVIIAFTSYNEVYLIDASYIIDPYRHNTVRHLDYEYFKEKGHLIRQGYAPRLCYLDIVDQLYFKEDNHENP